MMNRLCPDCKTRSVQAHFNSKWCLPCAKNRRTRPKSTLTREQKAFVVEMRGKISGREMAKELGVSWSNVMRFARDRRMSLATETGSCRYRMNPSLVRRVTKYYEKHGRTATEKAFPTVKVRSIVERYKDFSPRQTRWTQEQIIEVAKMAGLISFADQAKFFKRPNANAGAIKSIWVKKFKTCGGGVHGISDHMARHIVTDKCPRIVTKYWNTRRGSQEFGRKLCLWVDMEKHLRTGAPDFIADAVRGMADFQRWLFQTSEPKRAIAQMIANREHARRENRPL